MRREPDYTADGKKIRVLRQRNKHWKQEDLARATGMQVGSISRIETGYHQPQLASIAKIANALEVDLDDLVEWNVDF